MLPCDRQPIDHVGLSSDNASNVTAHWELTNELTHGPQLEFPQSAANFPYDSPRFPSHIVSRTLKSPPAGISGAGSDPPELNITLLCATTTHQLMESALNRFTLVLHCPNVIGIVYRVSKFLFDRQANITESAQYDDEDSDRFFMRVTFDLPQSTDTTDTLSDAFSLIATSFDMQASFHAESEHPRVLILASQWTHCLADLLQRYSSGELNVEIVGILSNHTGQAAELASQHNVPFEHLDIDVSGKAGAERRILSIMAERGVDLAVLARYMQILSDDFCQQAPCPVINIHHSFLPSFKGARPYHQAFARGVKIVGATAHYVTADLDEGPIIEQDVARVNHAMDSKGLVEIGRDLEKTVLARAVKLHIRHRVLPNGPRTVVFA